MKKVVLWAGVIAAGIIAAPAYGEILDVSATISAMADNGHFDYSIVLTNSSPTESIQTFWFAWVPGEDFLPTVPLSVTPPPDWTDIITHVPPVPTNGQAIQFKTAGAGLAPGESLTFLFTSNDTPAQVFGPSPFFDHPPVLTSFVYQGQPFQGDSLQFQVTPVPEPSSLIQGAVGVAACGGFGFLRRRARRRVAM
jgi:hypothetical protein